MGGQELGQVEQGEVSGSIGRFGYSKKEVNRDRTIYVFDRNKFGNGIFDAILMNADEVIPVSEGLNKHAYHLSNCTITIGDKYNSTFLQVFNRNLEERVKVISKLEEIFE